MSDRFARLIKRGDVILVPVPDQPDMECVVRDVSVVLHLADGRDHVVDANSDVPVVIDNFSEELLGQIEAMQSES